ncbi:MAG: hypothetical protein ACYDHT_00780 [Solirubrobacteraceae bacterium]
MSSPTRLSPTALAFRLLHATIAGYFLFAIGYVWLCALTGRRGPVLRLAVAALLGEGIVVSANGGDCPLGCIQARVGDPMPLFELVLSPTAARRAVPTLGLVAALGIGLLARDSQALPSGRTLRDTRCGAGSRLLR